MKNASGRFKARYIVRAYWPDHSDKPGQLAIESACEDEDERDSEIADFRAARERGLIGRIEVVSHVKPFGTTNV